MKRGCCCHLWACYCGWFSREIVYHRDKISHLDTIKVLSNKRNRWNMAWIFSVITIIKIEMWTKRRFENSRNVFPYFKSPRCQVHTFRFWSGDNGWVMLFRKTTPRHAIIVTSGGWGRWEAGGQARSGRRSSLEGSWVGLRKAVMRNCDSGWQLVRSVSQISLLPGWWSFRTKTGLSADFIRKKKSPPLSLTLLSP